MRLWRKRKRKRELRGDSKHALKLIGDQSTARKGGDLELTAVTQHVPHHVPQHVPGPLASPSYVPIAAIPPIPPSSPSRVNRFDRFERFDDDSECAASNLCRDAGSDAPFHRLDSLPYAHSSSPDGSPTVSPTLSPIVIPDPIPLIDCGSTTTSPTPFDDASSQTSDESGGDIPVYFASSVCSSSPSHDSDASDVLLAIPAPSQSQISSILSRESNTQSVSSQSTCDECAECVEKCETYRDLAGEQAERAAHSAGDAMAALRSTVDAAAACASMCRNQEPNAAGDSLTHVQQLQYAHFCRTASLSSTNNMYGDGEGEEDALHHSILALAYVDAQRRAAYSAAPVPASMQDARRNYQWIDSGERNCGPCPPCNEGERKTFAGVGAAVAALVMFCVFVV